MGTGCRRQDTLQHTGHLHPAMSTCAVIELDLAIAFVLPSCILQHLGGVEEARSTLLCSAAQREA